MIKKEYIELLNKHGLKKIDARWTYDKLLDVFLEHFNFELSIYVECKKTGEHTRVLLSDDSGNQVVRLRIPNNYTWNPETGTINESCICELIFMYLLYTDFGKSPKRIFKKSLKDPLIEQLKIFVVSS